MTERAATRTPPSMIVREIRPVESRNPLTIMVNRGAAGRAAR